MKTPVLRVIVPVLMGGMLLCGCDDPTPPPEPQPRSNFMPDTNAPFKPRSHSTNAAPTTNADAPFNLGVPIRTPTNSSKHTD